MTRTRDEDLAAALAECAREPVHIPGAIQPAGCLVCLDEHLERVCRVSANLPAFLGFSVEQALAGRAREVLGHRLCSQLQAALAESAGSEAATLTVTRRIDDRPRSFRVTAYRSGRRVVVELEPDHHRRTHHLLAKVNGYAARIAATTGTVQLLQVLADGVRTLTGHDRVMIYRFESDWSGSVITESVAPGHVRFLGHHFPASDIPVQVRRLYDINPVRSIPDSTVPSVPLVPEDGSPGDPPLDLSAGFLRAVSPIHLTYLRNMEVGASLSVALHGDGVLWGLLSCHNRTPVAVSPTLRDAVRTLALIATRHLFLLEAREEARYLEQVRNSRELLSGQRGTSLQHPGELLARHGAEWQRLFRACGAGLAYREFVSGTGDLPAASDLEALAAWLNTGRAGSRYWCTRALAEFPGVPRAVSGTYCGLMAVRLNVDTGVPGWLMLFRRERVERRMWAGRPDKLPERYERNRPLSPRTSFESWLEEITGCSEEWSTMEQRAAVELGEDLSVLLAADRIERLNTQLDRERGALEEANERLRRLAHTDPLTQVWNRYRMEQAIDTEMHAARRYGRPCALLLFDVDHFKRVNDLHGHEEGDRVLVRLTREVGNALRASDHLGRWGGEEFIVLARNSGIEEAAELAERLRGLVAGIDFGEAGRVTISIGVSVWRQGDERRALIARADQAMYRAKKGGRNLVCTEKC